MCVMSSITQHWPGHLLSHQDVIYFTVNHLARPQKHESRAGQKILIGILGLNSIWATD